MSVVYDAVENGVGVGRVADHLGPFVDGDWLMRMVERRP
jgi:hypothetical protein